MGAIVSGLFSAAGSIMGGQGQAAADKYNAAVSLNDATRAQMTAKANAGFVEQDVQRRTSEARAAQGGSGFDANTSSPLAVMSDLSRQGELKRRLGLYQGQVQSQKFSEQAQLEKAQATAALNASWWQAGTTVLTSLDKAANTMFPATMAGVGG